MSVLQVSVTDDDQYVEMINELEMIGERENTKSSHPHFAGNELWANVYGTDCLARIDQTSGSVTGWVVLQGILDRESSMARLVSVRSSCPFP